LFVVFVMMLHPTQELEPPANPVRVSLSVVGEQIKSKGIGRMNMQALGLVVLLPSILMLSTNESVPGELPATLIGAMAGYIFGVRNGD
ncbi:hypothetical protein AB0T83_20255, partial [Fluviibacterium sp. DFM31]